ncbi:OmpA family protein [Variovorax ginsengisoli]|uniref:Outer membrane protein OmpA-like peptidoglycan-associated protein n=1 Tax=Variovorax ginsengisoli TaxID=363844 RepID=A0ABT9SBS7_9BURK|nr:OmpA family protein [Variovorax ginsengisoli]MDP9900817.1 outer membrane protein OmpA-like peptidoglycan-associated protein [Variovorax ginsengisoli]
MLASLPAAAADVSGAADHPLLSRFKGAKIADYKVSAFDEATVPVKAIAGRDNMAPDDLKQLEGKVTRIGYVIEGDKTALEVMRNYEQALARGGFQVVFQCAAQRCGQDMGGFLANSGKVMPAGFNASFDDKNHYLLTRRTGADGDVHVLLWVVEDPANKRVLAYEQVIEGRPMDTGQVSVLTAAELGKKIEAEGRVAIYGVYFDTAQADVKPASRPSLDEMARLLTSNPALRVYVVGHTDNVGGLAPNVDLSQRRADAVVKALTALKIDPQRMTAKGVGPLAPLATNTSDAGRTRNRRVELVRQ